MKAGTLECPTTGAGHLQDSSAGRLDTDKDSELFGTRASAVHRGYFVASPALLELSPTVFRFVADLAEVYGSQSQPDGSTVVDINYTNRDVSLAIAHRLRCSDRTIDRRLSALRDSPIGIDWHWRGNRLTITLPAPEGKARPQVPKESFLSGTAMKVWVALQLIPNGTRRQLAAKSGLSLATVTRALSELEREAYVSRIRDTSKRALPGLIQHVDNPGDGLRSGTDGSVRTVGDGLTSGTPTSPLKPDVDQPAPKLPPDEARRRFAQMRAVNRGEQ